MMKELGHELNEQQLDEALKDLDINKDGVIDMEEFSRWYFTGMKPYNGSTRTILKIGGKAMQLLDIMGAEARAAIMGSELKLKESSMSIGFNAPEEPETIISVDLKLGG